MTCSTRECRYPGLFECSMCSYGFCANDVKMCEDCGKVYCLTHVKAHACKEIPKAKPTLMEQELAR